MHVPEVSPAPADSPGGGGATTLHATASPATGRSIVRAYDSIVVRLYCLVRFRIIRTRFLEELAQYLPTRGRVVEVGCGFGLFGLYFAATRPQLAISGFDIDRRRIELAERARGRLGLDNVDFRVGDARTAAFDGPVDAVYLLDVLHHIPPASARELIRAIHTSLTDDGILLVKDVATKPHWKMAFTWILDVLMTGGERPDYWSAEDMTAMLREVGFTVHRHALVDSLPYPHMLYIARKADA